MSKCKHNRLKMGYVEASIYADKQMRKGVKQTYCPKCKLWLWPCEVKGPKKPRMVRVKAWVDVFDYVVWKQKKDGVCYLYHDKIDGVPCYPVTILIDKKYLRRKP